MTQTTTRSLLALAAADLRPTCASASLADGPAPSFASSWKTTFGVLTLEQDKGYARCEEIAGKFYASPSYRDVKKALADRK